MIDRVRPWSVHIDISPRAAVDHAETLMQRLVAEHDVARFGAAPVVLRQFARSNHFEIVGCMRSDRAYDEYASSPAVVKARWSLATMLASPFDVRLYEHLQVDQWPHMNAGDLVTLSQIELRQDQLDGGVRLLDQYLTLQGLASGVVCQVTLKRAERVGLFDLMSVWSTWELADSFLATESVQHLRRALSTSLVAPIEDRRHEVVNGLRSAR